MIGRALVLLALSASAAPAEPGIASIYGNGDGHEWTSTANGETVDPAKLTAAHRTLPFGSMVSVTNHATGRCVMVRINDRGPFKAGRVIDLTPAGAEQILCKGLCRVDVNRGRCDP